MSIEIEVKRHGYIVNDVAIRPMHHKEDFRYTYERMKVNIQRFAIKEMMGILVI